MSHTNNHAQPNNNAGRQRFPAAKPPTHHRRLLLLLCRAAFATICVFVHMRVCARTIIPNCDDGNIFPRYSAKPLPLCGREAIRRGKWFEIIKEGNVTAYRWDVVADATDKGTNSSCQFQAEFDSEHFCNLMANTVIWILGDSIMWEMYVSLVKLATDLRLVLKKRINVRVNSHGTRAGFPVIVNVCNNSKVTIMYRWTYRLEGIGKMLTQQFPTMIVLNTGAHYMPDEKYCARMNHTIEWMEGWQELCRGRNLTCPFYWRTSAPGIPNCMTFTHPVNGIAEMERFVAAESPGVGGAPPFYNWEKFQHQNDIAYEMLGSSALSYDVIPGYEIGIQRPDTRVSEVDCLHSSNPAIADAENIVLLHYLRESRTEEDVAWVSRYRYDFDRATNINKEGTDLDWNLVNREDYPY